MSDLSRVVSGVVSQHAREIPAGPRAASLFAVDEAAGATWDARDLGPILRHLLDSPLPEEVSRALDGATTTMRELLASESPSIAVLDALKDFAKRLRTRGEGALPPEVATAVYQSAIAAALVRHRQRITSLDDNALRSGLQWVRERDWADPYLRELCAKALEGLG